MSGAANTLWARSFVDELARLGVVDVVIAPGSRSTPLVMAFATDGRFAPRVHLDERSAAFFALGVGKATGRPAAVVTTSGTAAANVYPAVLEAAAAGVPLLVLTADRPPRLTDSDANQALDQVGMYGDHVREAFSLPLPTSVDVDLRYLRAVAARAVAAARAPQAGPVHVNFPFEKPLEPLGHASGGERGIGGTGREGGAPFVDVRAGRVGPSERDLDALVATLGGTRGVIVAGPSAEPWRTGPAVLELARRTGMPLLADPLSGARYAAAEGVVRPGAYDLFLDDADVAAALAPSAVLRVGRSPTSAVALAWLARHADVPQVVVDDGPGWKDHGATATGYVVGDPAATLVALAERTLPPVDAGWRAMWSAAERGALAAIADDDGVPHEGDVAAAVLDAVPSGATIFVSSSMPIRDVDAFSRPREQPVRVLANRGVSGIDGVVSSAFGVASRSDGPTVCLLGDLAFFHDQNGLLWSRERDVEVAFVLVDNDGGGIFHQLPIADHEPHFTDFFATPHGLDFEHVARLHGLSFRDVVVGEVGDAVSAVLAAGGTTVIRVRTDRRTNHLRHAEVREQVRRSVRRALAALSEARPAETTVPTL